MQIPDPKYLTWYQWANTVAGFNPEFGQYVTPHMPWQNYADSLTYLLPNTPRHNLYKSWEEWAVALKQAV